MELDHVFILTDAGAPGAAALQRLGIREGSTNTHPGQGTACRRFFFANAYLELAWVENEAEAGAGDAKRTRLLDRWAMRRAGACPFGVIMRPTADEIDMKAPFPTWRYAPSYFPEGFAIEVAAGTSIGEPEIFYMPVQRGRGRPSQPLNHEIPAVAVHQVAISGPLPAGLSDASRQVAASGAVRFEEASAYTLALDFRSVPDTSADLRPELPLILRW